MGIDLYAVTDSTGAPNLCFSVPEVLFGLEGTAGIWDAEYWIRCNTKNAREHFDYMNVSRIDEGDVESRDGPRVVLNCSFIDKTRESIRTGNMIGCQDQGSLTGAWAHLVGICGREGFELVKGDRNNWEDYKVWRAEKFAELQGGQSEDGN